MITGSSSADVLLAERRRTAAAMALLAAEKAVSVSHALREQSLSRALRAWAALPWVLVRASMIYGPGDDRNISRLAARLRRRRILPIPGSGRHLHQPVHVDDVVAGLLAAAEVQGIEGCSYALAGAAPLPYAELVAAVGAALGVGLRHAIHNPALARAAAHEVDDGVADVLLRVVCVGGVRR